MCLIIIVHGLAIQLTHPVTKARFTPSNYLQVVRLGNNCKNDIDHPNFPRLFKVTVNKTKLVAIRVGTCKPLKTKLTVFAELDYQPPRYRGHQNKLDCITHQIIRKLRV